MQHFTNARIYRFEPRERTYSCAASLSEDQGRIVALDDAPGAGAQVRDLDGATVVAAFGDAHVHLDGTGLRAGPNDLSAVRDARTFARHIEGLPQASRMFAAGFDDARWPDGKADAAVLERYHADSIALIARVDAHSSLVNRKTFAWLALDAQVQGIERGADGRPTGRLSGEANWLAQSRFFAGYPAAARRSDVQRAVRLALSQGAVHLHAQLVGVGSAAEIAGELDFLASLTDAKIVPKICERDPALAASLGLRSIGGDVFLDGSLGSGTAALCEPYRDRPGNGELALRDDEVQAYFGEAENLGISAGVHAIGDRALEQALNAIEHVLDGRPSTRTQHFIEHAELLSDAALARCARLKLALSMQPQFDAAWGGDDGMYAQRLGRARARTMNRIGTLRESGALVAGGSDSPVCALSPLDGMRAACTHSHEAERLSPLDALTMFSYDVARFAGVHGTYGRLHPGFDADFVVLDRDPFVDGSFARTGVLQTWHAGRCVYDRDAT